MVLSWWSPGGGWGIGALEEEAQGGYATYPAPRSLSWPDATQWCGDSCEQAFATESRVVVLGFTERMSDLLAAADVLVHSTGGVTVLEALARGCPVVSYGELPGHLQQTSKDMASIGVVSPAKTPVELESILRRVVAAGTKGAVDYRGRNRVRRHSYWLGRSRVVPLPAWRVRGVRACSSAHGRPLRGRIGRSPPMSHTYSPRRRSTCRPFGRSRGRSRAWA